MVITPLIFDLYLTNQTKTKKTLTMTHRTTLLKLLGTATIALTLTACGNASTDTNVKTPAAAAQNVTSTAQKVSQGTFSGRSDHITTGQVTLEKTATGYQLRFSSNFELDGAPDPVVAIGNGETYQVANKLGKLKNRTGEQVYTLPASFKPGQFSQVYVWCEQFSVPLGVADLGGASVAKVSQGTFSGRSDHITTGQVKLEKTANGYQLSFAADFELDGAPDPIVAIGNGGKYLPINKIGKLKNRTGRQVYQLPASFKPGQFSQVYVWCEQFSVPLGIADLT